MKQRTVFKVVLNSNNGLISTMQTGCSMVYKPNNWIKPKVGKIFAFKTQVHAEKFIETCPLFKKRCIQIWKAVGKKPSEIKSIVCIRSIKGFIYPHINRFWNVNGNFPKTLEMKSPEGTVVVNEIKLLKRVMC